MPLLENAVLPCLLTPRHMRRMSHFQGETAEEVAGLAKAMRARCVHVPTSGDVLDIVGTGGDGIGSVNISTGATVIAAAAGAKVAKHGNRSVSSLCGSADVLEVHQAAMFRSPLTISVSWTRQYYCLMWAVDSARRDWTVVSICRWVYLSVSLTCQQGAVC